MNKWLAILTLAPVLFFVGCTPTNTQSLITDAFSLGDCPELSCAQGVADPADTKVVLSSPLSVQMPVGNSFVEISGECYPSLYPQNQFNVLVTNSAGTIQPNAQILPAGFVARCDSGKFYVPISLQGRAAGLYNVTLTLQVTTSLGQIIVPPFKTVTATYNYRPQ
ncbi:MAG: hypothetical protein ACK5V3_15700 [Bdellovibrionales bacterium]